MGAGTSLAVQRLRLCAYTAEGEGSIPGQGTKILHAVWCGQNIKKKKKKLWWGKSIGELYELNKYLPGRKASESPSK